MLSKPLIDGGVLWFITEVIILHQYIYKRNNAEAAAGEVASIEQLHEYWPHAMQKMSRRLLIIRPVRVLFNCLSFSCSLPFFLFFSLSFLLSLLLFSSASSCLLHFNLAVEIGDGDVEVNAKNLISVTCGRRCRWCYKRRQGSGGVVEKVAN